MPLFVYVLGLAVFAQGTSEFMLSGLVPGIAADLSVPSGAAASLTSAYAVGMVVGAPLMAALAARWPRRRALAGFLTAFVGGGAPRAGPHSCTPAGLIALKRVRRPPRGY
ncbi:MFS transporter [Actinosynnema sp. NPDC059335]|uniref:MFS transporter n=1 Tax=Actinosynnema sp. NPDC059335 TaxID=3346804 RepID=UPI00366FD8B5